MSVKVLVAGRMRLFAVMEVSPSLSPLSYSVSPRTHTHRHTNVNVQ